MPEALKIWPTIFFKVVGQVIQVRDTIFDDSESLRIKTVRTVKEIYDASADYGVQCHQRPFILACHSGPPLLLMGFPE